MAVVINSALSSEISNSYVSQAYCDDYWDNHFSSTKSAQWANLADGQKVGAIVRACQVIESARFTVAVTLPEYAIHYDRHTGKVLDMNLTRQPVKYYYYQRLQFPRNIDVYYQNPPTGAALGDHYVPEAILIAQCEQALYMLNVDETAVANRLQGVTLDKIGVGKGQIEATQEYSVTGSLYAPIALEMVRPFLVRGGRMARA